MSFGVWSLFPVLIIIVFALWTKDTFISIFIGVIVAFMMHAKGNPIVAFNEFLDTLYKVMTSNVTAWVLLVCGLFGSLIMLVTEAGGALGFSNLCEKFLKTRKAALLGTWLLGIIVCVDDYLNSLAVGAAVRKVTDREKVSREMVAFIVNSTGVTVCAIVPFSSWAAFMGGVNEKIKHVEWIITVRCIYSLNSIYDLRLVRNYLCSSFHTEDYTIIWSYEVSGKTCS